MANHHRHVHDKDDEPKSVLRDLAVPIILFIILAYAAQWAFRIYPRTDPRYLAGGIAIAGAATFLWILNPRKDH